METPDNSSLTNGNNEAGNTHLVEEVPFTPFYLILDFVLRFLIHFLYLNHVIGSVFFWIIQLLLIPALTLSILINHFKKKEKEWLNHFSKDNVKIEVNIPPIYMLLIFSSFILGLYISWQLYSAYFSFWISLIFIVLTFLSFGLYVALICNFSVSKFSKKKIEENANLLRDAIDDNDVKLVKQEVKAGALSQRVDTYTLESALLGALAFTCFLTILGVDPKLPAEAKLLLFEFYEIFILFLTDWSGLIKYVAAIEFNNVGNILSVMAIQSLVCSFLYLLVIVTRLSFYKKMQDVLIDTRLAREFNQKEESYDAFLQQQGTEIKNIKTKLTHLTKTIEKYIDEGERNFRVLDYIITYMSILRQGALYLFVLLTATAACIVSVYIGLFLILLFLLSLFLFQTEFFLKFAKSIISRFVSLFKQMPDKSV